jgi:energy-coupling factor transporter ATP-binding protein EcfA2
MARMGLLKYRVTDFRSVEDSGWIETDDVTALIGTNESGKTNLLLPLWKFHPANDGEISLLSDAPRKKFNDFRNMATKPYYIDVYFELDDGLAQEVAGITGADPESVRVVSVKRRLDPEHKWLVTFPNEAKSLSVHKNQIQPLLSDALDQIESLDPSVKAEGTLKQTIIDVISSAVTAIAASADQVGAGEITTVSESLSSIDLSNGGKNSAIVPRYQQLIDAISELQEQVSRPSPSQNEDARQVVINYMPKFVYYSNYGNLDSEIYLPHVIENLARKEELGSRESAKARTLKVLFEFVRLNAQEILDMGRGPEVEDGEPPSEEEIEESAKRTKEREVLLQSASSSLTSKFRDWWKQGTHRIRFQADGEHFRIWVSDELRPEEIELEGRSTGLQWFLSFYLIFLVESRDAHQGAILLLDEPGLSLHPIAQRDLSRFFSSLSQSNQLLYTTHSPFLVDADHLDRVRSVYVDDDGLTVASPDLRANEKKSSQTDSIYAVHAAIGLSVSDMILQGCEPVIVEGVSDQFYLSGIKTLLIGDGSITPDRELVFVPSGGAKGVTAVAPILAAKSQQLPMVLLDSDTPGKQQTERLKSGIYQPQKDRILAVSEFVGFDDSEIEDLYPSEIVVWAVDRKFRQDDLFEDEYQPGQPMVGQIEAYAQKQGVKLEDGWKVELAKIAKERLLKQGIASVDATVKESWVKLFEKFA